MQTKFKLSLWKLFSLSCFTIYIACYDTQETYEQYFKSHSGFYSQEIQIAITIYGH